MIRRGVPELYWAIIADDLTGANDSGVQLTRRGYPATVLIDPEYQGIVQGQHLVIDTDSRAEPRQEAYRRVFMACRAFRSLGYASVYKKIDSTMRGNVGIEIDAVYDALRPELVVIAPGYPKNGRTVLDGRLLLGGIPIDETEFAGDPKTPVRDASVVNLLRAQTARPIHVVRSSEMDDPAFRLSETLMRCIAEGTRYVLFDTTTEEHLRWIANEVTHCGVSVVWVGSAGLVRHLPMPDAAAQPSSGSGIASARRHVDADQSILFVVGSVSGTSGRQLQALSERGRGSVAFVVLRSEAIVAGGGSTDDEIERVVDEAIARHGAARHLVVCSSRHPEDVRRAMETGERRGLSRSEVSDAISGALAVAAARLVERLNVGGLVLTGGDTARRVCLQLGADWMELVGEVEEGMPIGMLVRGAGTDSATRAAGSRIVVTKAGGFGTDDAFLNAITALRGEDTE